MEIQVGTLAIGKRQTGVCEIGEVGVCYEVYELEERPGYSFIFESGRYDGFHPNEVERFLMLPNIHCLTVSSYKFRNVLKLRTDFRAGFFAPAFELWV
jgi:hypothetical protein